MEILPVTGAVLPLLGPNRQIPEITALPSFIMSHFSSQLIIDIMLFKDFKS